MSTLRTLLGTHTHLTVPRFYPRIGKGIEPEDVLPSTEQGLVCGWTTGRQHWMWQTSSQASSPGLSWPRCGKQVEQARRSDGCFCCLLLPVGLVIQGAVVLRAFCSICDLFPCTTQSRSTTTGANDKMTFEP